MLEVYRHKEALDLSPPYQRLSVWDRPMQERFIDSIINGFDIPKLYFHELPISVHIASGHTEQRFRYSVIDGKQRLLALWAFIKGEITLPADFTFFDDQTIQAAGATYVDLIKAHPTLRARFDSYDLPVTIVEADDEDFIESLFWRLNIQRPLTGAERRNAFGAPLPYRIRRLAVSPFFTSTVAHLPNHRLQHYDIAARFIYIVRANLVVSTKREVLDNFVQHFNKLRADGEEVASDGPLDELERRTLSILRSMSEFFQHHDPLLKRIGRVMLYFHVFRIHRKVEQEIGFTRPMLMQFDEEVAAARSKADRRAGGSDEPLDARDVYLREFDRHKQSTNDAGALRQQYGYLARYLLEEFAIQVPQSD